MWRVMSHGKLSSGMLSQDYLQSGWHTIVTPTQLEISGGLNMIRILLIFASLSDQQFSQHPKMRLWQRWSLGKKIQLNASASKEDASHAKLECVDA
jgi:hypothetical protein